jgi:branched-subunit amino acid transport protein
VTPDRSLIAAVLILAAGTYALRLSGTVLRARIELSCAQRTLIDRSVAVLFCALVATSALLEDGHPVGAARSVGVAVAGLLAWRRAPFVLVVVAAAGATAALRLAGIP